MKMKILLINEFLVMEHYTSFFFLLPFSFFNFFSFFFLAFSVYTSKPAMKSWISEIMSDLWSWSCAVSFHFLHACILTGSNGKKK